MISPEQSKTTTRWLPPLLVSLALLILVFSLVKWESETFLQLWQRLDPLFVVGITLLFFPPALIRGVRFRLLLNNGPPPSVIMGALLLHQSLLVFLPFRSGEISLPLILRQQGIPIARSVAILLLSRLLDMISILLFMTLLWEVIGHRLPPSYQVLHPILWSLLLGFFLFFSVLFFARRWVVTKLESVIRSLCRHLPKGKWMIERWEVFLEAITSVPPGVLWRAGILSLMIWPLNATLTVFLCQNLIPQVDSLSTTAAGTLAALMGYLPIHGLAGVGTQQAVTVFLFSPLGLSNSEALAFSVLAHAIYLWALVVMGGVGWFLLHRRQREGTHS